MNRSKYLRGIKTKRKYKVTKISKRLYYLSRFENWLNWFKDKIWNPIVPHRWHWPTSIFWHLKLTGEIKRLLDEPL